METKITTTNRQYIAEYVHVYGANYCATWKDFEERTLKTFANFLKGLEITEANRKNGQKAQWSRITPRTLSKYIHFLLNERKTNTFQIQQQVLVIDSFLRWAYETENKHYRNICDAAIKQTYIMNNVLNW